ncbi:MAG: GNAT family N-acetyltransferase [Bacteroidales bacterium]|nr:GNAT family N-acetyltransferase [Bacteroidales bacterium]MBN2699710.1 GNAT family N-acetyltransferase [Bacteroidales bacterium]
MKEIIPPVPVDVLTSELTKEKFIRKTNKGGNEIYIITAENAPGVMKEIGRLRELSFRNAGGGTGLDCDLDAFDSGPHAYKQLIVWDPDEEAILGGYRFYICDSKNCLSDGTVNLATASLFDFSETFVKDYLPDMIELGRSFVQPTYQSTSLRRKGIYALDNLWDGLGSIVLDNPDKKYLFGKVTMYLHYHQMARDMILFFLNKHFPDKEGLVKPREPLKMITDRAKLTAIFTGRNYQENYKILSREVRACGENIPPLINAYMNLSPSMQTFGTVLNKGFGDVEETGIMITINDLYKAKIERHMANYIPIHLRKIKSIRSRDYRINQFLKRFNFNKPGS